MNDDLAKTIKQFVVYTAFGVFTTAVYYVLWWVLFTNGVDYRAASGVGYGVGSLVNYGLQKWVTFKDKSGRGAMGPQLVVYWIIVGLSLALTVGGVWLVVATMGLQEWLAVIIVSAFILLFNFGAHKWITFNPALWIRNEVEGSSKSG